MIKRILKTQRKCLILILLGILFYSHSVAEISYTEVGSFNTLHLGWKNKDYKEIAKVIMRFDLVGLQEVMNEDGLVKTITELKSLTGSEWGYLISEKSVGKKNYREFYGYIWRSDKVKLISSLGYYPEDSQDDFIREPYGAIFKIGKCDFTLVLCHLIFGKSINERREEAMKLHNVYSYFQYKNNEEQDVIIAGDFNLPGNDKGFNNLLTHPDILSYLIQPSDKTTIGKNGLVSSYDNFFISQYTKEVVSSKVYYYSNDYNKMRKNISDHLPILLHLDVRSDDD